jgi:hypothetical protein
MERGTNKDIDARRTGGQTQLVVSIAEYRKLLKDHTSSDGDIDRRLGYLEALCRHVIREELTNYVGT